ncbi:ureidoglycolate hydrolase [Colletotrichum sojae]|uniref:Ureidoglycolate hydrolase n=1 Tax=Colletotrichum sojae TaxID=2175907 RepID=A0A8H6JQL0_9PEZI|nr:ureidoglycolate hydrolase [Colletotrichum sojae]
MPPSTISTPLSLLLPAEPLTKGAFAPFGDVIENPLPDVRPSPSLQSSPLLSSANAVTANQGTAIKYQNVSVPLNLYPQSPSGDSKPIASIFSCATRPLEPSPAPSPPPISTLLPYTNAAHRGGRFRVGILERHPFTTQTFVPFGSSPSFSYLVIVAPTDPTPSPSTDSLPSPKTGGKGSGLPALERLRAFVASPGQAVTYAAGTWHAPMVALGPAGAAVDFVVTQFASGVAEEDCQEVLIEAAAEGAGVVVQVPERAPVAKL